MNNKGQSLLGVLIFGGLVLAIGAAILPSILPVRKYAASRVTKSSLSQVLYNLQTCIQDGPAWAETVNDPANASLACLQSGQTCAPNPSSSASPRRIVVLHETANRLCNQSASPGKPSTGFDNRIPGAGFDITGLPCTSFDPVNGNDGCPYHIELTWTLNCLGGAPACSYPAVKVTGQVSYKPRDLSSYLPLNMNQDAGLSFVINRSASGSDKTFFVFETAPAGQPPSQPCVPGTPVSRSLNQVQMDDGGSFLSALGSQVTVQDPSGQAQTILDPNRTLIVNQDSAGKIQPLSGLPPGSLQLLPGIYTCEGSAPAFFTGGNQIALAQVSPGTPPRILANGYGTSGSSPQSSVGMVTRSFVRASGIVLSGPTPTIALLHSCALAIPPGNPAPRVPAMSLGIPGSFQAELYAVLRCTAEDPQSL